MITNTKFQVMYFATLIVLIYCGFILISYKTGIQHDHVYYLKIWELDAQGVNPYSINNPYGPVNILIGKLIIFDSIENYQAIKEYVEIRGLIIESNDLNI